MKKFIVETYYTCTFKTVHTLNDLNDKELSKIDSRDDGKVEVIDVKLNNRKTKKVGNENKTSSKSIEIDGSIPKSISSKIQNNIIPQEKGALNLKTKNKADLNA